MPLRPCLQDMREEVDPFFTPMSARSNQSLHSHLSDRSRNSEGSFSSSRQRSAGRRQKRSKGRMKAASVEPSADRMK
jgi:hypothetical protein